MEDDSNACLSTDVHLFDLPINGVTSPVMAKSPDGNVTVAPEDDRNSCGGEVTKSNEDTSLSNDKVNAPLTKINGDNVTDSATSKLYDNDSYDSESDALVIDLGATKKQKSNKKKKHDSKPIEEQLTHKPEDSNNINDKSVLANDVVVTHSNPFFNESLFELSQLHQNTVVDNDFPVDPPSTNNSVISNNNGELKKPQKRLNNKNKPKPKLKEYAQYLGLQPTVQFKCSKCGQSGFESLSTLQEHIVQCDSVIVNVPAAEATTHSSSTSATEENSCSGFKLTRKVFLCSACGTYYENWNLYMHMLEFHRRYICLYCLGMFSILEDLCQHIQSRHNLVPGHKSSLDEFFNVYNEPCYVVCCECNKLFSEQDNFFYHNCVGSSNNNNKNSNKNKKGSKQQITPENHVTGETEETTIESEKHTVADDITSIKDKNETNYSSDAMETSEQETLKEAKLLRKSIDTRKYSVDEECVGFEKNPKHFDCMSENAVVTATEKDEENTRQNDNDDAVAMETSENISNDISDKVSEDKKYFDDNNIDNNEVADADHSSNNIITSTETNNKSDSFDEAVMNDEDDDYDDNNADDEVADCHRSSDSEIKEENENPTNVDNDNTTTMEMETRKVPKLSLKLPKPGSFPTEADDSDDEDSDKLTMEVDRVESENENDISQHQQEPPINVSNATKNEPPDEDESKSINTSDTVNINDNTSNNTPQQPQVAGADVPIIELELEQPLDKFDARILLQKCLKTTIASCIYCNHARKIAVNGKQLALHCIAEHRFSAVVKSITAEELIPESFVNRFKESMDQLQDVFFNLESSFSQEAITFSHLFECFQCYFSTTVHKELYLHNRKYHSKNLLLCIMCKSNFFSYSELICHLCPGMYVLDYDLQFRCCMCVNDDLPSSFRLMVHLRKRHNVCDVCLEMCHTQYRLSNHVWKHKLNHFCYRCGIAYRNKPDITRHLFWKHGTESVLCKRCLQKKWPHMYHFCVPPASFSCDECTQTFSRAVALKVHKRLHVEDGKKHMCTFDGCKEAFISRKLMLKHETRHRDPPPQGVKDDVVVDGKRRKEGDEEEDEEEVIIEDRVKKEEFDEFKKEIDNNREENELYPKKAEDTTTEDKPIKPKIDVLDLPALNLSESDSSDSETEPSGANHVAKIDEEKSQELTTTTCLPSTIDETSISTLVAADKEEKEEENKSSPDDVITHKDETQTQNVQYDDDNKASETTNNSNNVDDVDCQIQNMELENTNNVIQSIWDNFKNYQASKEKLDNMFVDPVEKYSDPIIDIPVPIIEEEKEEEEVFTTDMALRDHDYCIDPENKPDTSLVEAEPALSESVDHDYCSSKTTATTPERGGGKIAEKPPMLDLPPSTMNESIETTKLSNTTPKREKKPTEDSSSSSSSDNDSSSCSCGTNCSCSSSSSSSSSSSDSSNSDSSTEEGRQKQLARRKKRKERAKKLKEKSAKVKQQHHENDNDDNRSTNNDEIQTVNVDEVIKNEVAAPQLLEHVEIVIRESDLETDESETDEEFYDKAPHKIAKKMQEEKRLQMLAISTAATNVNDVDDNVSVNNNCSTTNTNTATITTAANAATPINIPNGTFFESTSRPPTPPAGSFTVEEEAAGEERKRKKSKSKKRKKRKSEKRELLSEETNNHHHHSHHNQEQQFSSIIGDDVPIPPYYQQFHQQQLPQQIMSPPIVAPLTLSLSRNSPIPSHHHTLSGNITPTNRLSSTSSMKTSINNINNQASSSSSMFGSGNRQQESTSQTDSSLRASKRRRVPNKFYGYSSDEEEKEKSTTSPFNKWRKLDNPSTPKSPMVVPPITIKTTPQLPSVLLTSHQAKRSASPAIIVRRTPPLPPSSISSNQHAMALPSQLPAPPPPPAVASKQQQQQHLTVEPISIKTGTHLSDFRVRQRPRKRPKPKQQQQQRGPGFGFATNNDDSGSDDSNDDDDDSSSDDQANVAASDRVMDGSGVVKPAQPQLYCYCRCPYDEVSEMIGCDASDCAIEWFHFECVGIMVPPKGQWFCPDCRKKKQQRQMMLLQQQHQNSN